MTISEGNLDRGITAQLEALNMIETIHNNDRQGYDDLTKIAVSSTDDLLRAAVVIADMVLTIPDPENFPRRLGQLRKAFSRAGGAE